MPLQIKLRGNFENESSGKDECKVSAGINKMETSDTTVPRQEANRVNIKG